MVDPWRFEPDKPCLVIAEAGVNHDGDVARAHRLVEVAAQAGADAVKFQSFRTGELVSPSTPKAPYQVDATGDGESQGEMLARLELSPAAQRDVAAHCDEKGITFLSTPFDLESAELLVDIGVPALKVPSGELTNLPFLKALAGLGRPLIVSTGMATLDEVRAAVEVLTHAGCDRPVLLHCVSLYPAPPETVNLRALQTMSDAFGLPVGLSDHTLGTQVAFAAVALGASVIEKHFTTDRTLPGPDHAASLEPAELKDLVDGIRIVEAALGHGRKEPAAGEADVAAVARRSLVAARDLPLGAVLTEDAIAIMRPGTGLAPGRLAELLGRSTVRAVAAGALLRLEDLA